MPPSNRPLRILSFLLVLSATPVLSHAAESTFDADDEGWQTCNVDFTRATTTVDGFAPAAYASEGGNPGGSILFLDGDPGWNFFAAPSAFLGDQSAAFGSTLSYDTETDRSDPGSVYPAAVLRSGSTFLYCLTAPPAVSWSHVDIPLLGASWSLSPTSDVAVGDAALLGVLARLDGLYVDADWASGMGETARLDNVRLQAVPEPCSALAFGLGAWAWRRRRR